MVSEISDSHSLAQNFVYLSTSGLLTIPDQCVYSCKRARSSGVAWQVGCTTGPAFGGLLARPAKAWPRFFENTIFELYPYALPTVAVTILPALSVVAGAFFLRETSVNETSSSQASSTEPSGSPRVIRNRPPSSSFMVRIYRACVEKIYPTNGLPPLGSCGAYFMFLVEVSYQVGQSNFSDPV